MTVVALSLARIWKGSIVTPILMYHSISCDPEKRLRPFTVPPRQFEDHARFIVDHGYLTLTVSELIERRQHRSNALPAKPVVLTFDDGFADFYEEALPILTKYGLAATLYVVSGCIGGTSRWLGSNGAGSRPLLNWRQLSEVAKAGIEIGSHTQSHPALDTLPAPAAKAEILHSKLELQDRLGLEVRSLAYPYGYYSQAVREFVRSAGYASACAVGYATSSPSDDRFALSRHIVRQSADTRRLEGLLSNRGVSIRTVVDRVRSATWTRLRHALYANQSARLHHG